MTKDQIKKEFKEELETCTDFSFPDAWAELVYLLMSVLKKYRQRNNLPTLNVLAIKDKYGALRFYCLNDTDLESKWIAAASTISYGICEKCGSKSNVTQIKINSWIYTLCDQCQTNI